MKRIIKNIVGLFKDTDKILIFMTCLYAIIGIFLILSASSITSTLELGTPYYYFKRQILTFILSICVSICIIYLFNSKSYHVIGKWGTIILSAYLLFAIFNGIAFKSGNYEVTINLGFTSLQPAEFIKVLLILYVATSYNRWSLMEKHYRFDFIIPMLLCAIPIAFIFISGDKGSAITMLIIVSVMYLFVPTKSRAFRTTKVIGLTLMICAFLFLKFAYKILPEDSSNYIYSRLNYKNPCDRYQLDSGYQVCNGFIAIDNGGLFGKGIGKSTQKYLYLPASHTDFIFPIIVEELGVLVSIAIIIGYMVIAYRIFYISSKCYNLRNSLICFGIGIYFLCHIFINLGGVLGLIPLTGIPLPLLSYGGSSMLAMFCAFSIVQRINIENKRYKKNKDINKIING